MKNERSNQEYTVHNKSKELLTWSWFGGGH